MKATHWVWLPVAAISTSACVREHRPSFESARLRLTPGGLAVSDVGRAAILSGSLRCIGQMAWEARESQAIGGRGGLVLDQESDCVAGLSCVRCPSTRGIFDPFQEKV